MADQQNPHFEKIFWFCVYIITIGFGYIFYVTIAVIPDKNQRTVDTVVGFALGSMVMSAVGYLLGGNPTAQKPKPADNNVEQMDVAADNVNVKETT